jgi:hypothetical protein
MMGRVRNGRPSTNAAIDERRRLSELEPMRILQDAIDEFLQDLPEQALAALIEKKLTAQGVKLSARQRKLLTRRLMEDTPDTIRFRNWKWWENQNVTLEFTQEDVEQIERNFTEFADNRLPDVLDSATHELAHKTLTDLKRRWPAYSRKQRGELATFRKHLYGRWKIPLESLRMLVTMSREIGDSVNREIRQSPDAARQRHSVDVLARSHARGCQIAEEILTLLEAGFADGAMARWRTIHEIAVMASFIAAHGEELAERYVLHTAVESKRAADEYQKCQPRLGYEPLPVKEIETVQKAYEAAISKYGPDFAKGDYGWAGHHLSKTKPTFRDIEAAVNIDHFRAHYRLASYNVHANPKGVFFKLGMLAESQVLLAGPSNAGLADPGHGAAISLSRVTAALVELQQPPTLDNNVVLLMMVQLVDEIGESFGQAHERLEADETALRPARAGRNR